METGYCQRQTHFGPGMRDLGERIELLICPHNDTSFRIIEPKLFGSSPRVPHCHMSTSTAIYRPCIIKPCKDTMKNQALARIIDIKNPEACFGKKNHSLACRSKANWCRRIFIDSLLPAAQFALRCFELFLVRLARPFLSKNQQKISKKTAKNQQRSTQKITKCKRQHFVFFSDCKLPFLKKDILRFNHAKQSIFF
jgi:hypothetical protein